MTAELFKTHYGLSGSPFSLAPDADFLFWSPFHTKAFAVLEYGLLSGAPITVLTGDVGAGKTTLLHALLQKMPEESVVAMIPALQSSQDNLIRWILSALDLTPPPGSGSVEVYQMFQNAVIEEFAKGNRVVLIIDEAQNLGPDRLEELRMLTNMNSGDNSLLQLILVGQPELRTLLSQRRLRQFAQRVSVYYHLKPMKAEETRAYIRHRLCHVGGTGDEIDPTAVDRIVAESNGVPRIVNKLCDLSMVFAAGSGRKTVGLEDVEELLEEGFVMTLERPFLLTGDMEPDDGEEPTNLFFRASKAAE